MMKETFKKLTIDIDIRFQVEYTLWSGGVPSCLGFPLKETR
jgi:hypothetical protein